MTSLVTLNEWNVSTRAAIAATGRSVNKAAISADLSSAFNRTLSGGRPRASAATFAALAAAAAAAAVTRFVSKREANWTRAAAETVLVFIAFQFTDYRESPGGSRRQSPPVQIQSAIPFPLSNLN